MSVLSQIVSDTVSDQDFMTKLNNLSYVLFSNAVSVRQREMMAERFARFYKASLFLVDFFQQHPQEAKHWLKMFNLSTIVNPTNNALPTA